MRLYPEKKIEKRKNKLLKGSDAIFYACNEYIGRIFLFSILFEIGGREY